MGGISTHLKRPSSHAVSYQARIILQHAQLGGVIGCVYGTFIAIVAPKPPPAQKAPTGAGGAITPSKQWWSAVERYIGVLNSSFRCLERYGVLHYGPRKAGTTVAACGALRNLCLHAGESYTRHLYHHYHHNDNATMASTHMAP
ncbi:hypothetical protein HPB49_011730 [Dermacentor silvarum]|uniref:Uncharacterized protein n=1 Tax=Dermacentor silvarum TaxID=543639 RepID=A0ACB8CQY8_DERSI|nr:hypothetical protein HPB49_011730 [Dermacentor silvarum]